MHERKGGERRRRVRTGHGSTWVRARGRRLLAPTAIVALVIASLSLAVTWTVAGARSAPTCFGTTPTITGTPQGEVIRGTSGPDVIMSFGGNDGVLSRQGNDYVCSGSGNDTVHAAEGFNRVNGGDGDDWIDGRRGPGNVVLGGDGADHVEAEGKIDGGAGDDIIESYGYLDPSLSPVPDIATGGAGRDDMYGCGATVAPQRPTTAPGAPRERSGAWPACYTGGPGNGEVLAGGPDPDRIFGGDGNDRLQGQDGSDALYGEVGNDDLDGGPGSDVCAQNAGTGSRISCP